MRPSPLVIDLASRAVTLAGGHVTLTCKQYRPLHALTWHLGPVVAHNRLIKKIWSNTSAQNVQYLWMLVRKLRQKLEADPAQ